ncbi:MAG TPA: methylisocitrate lyase [Trebonia sp.]|nr:methylisocitrate lyase [Trebonia sp.]
MTTQGPGVTATVKRERFRTGLASGQIQRLPGAFSPLAAAAIESHGFEGIYISGAALAADLGLPDIGLTSLGEVAERGRQIARVTDLPALIDADTGFGEPANVARTVSLLEDAGLAGCHLEDQVNPKRCGHLDSKAVVSRAEMLRRVRAAVVARRDSSFVICARTDARAVEGLDGAIKRAKAYADAGADMIFPEALQDEQEFAVFRAALDLPLVANMTEFGRSPLLSASALEDLGYNAVIWPVTLLRAAMGAAEEVLSTLSDAGTQEAHLPAMQTRARLYDLIRYRSYAAFDEDIANFEIPGTAE